MSTANPKVTVPKGEMYVKVYAPYQVYFEGPAKSVSAVNDTGPFDVLAGHHRFLTLLSPCDVIVRTSTEQKNITIQSAVMYVQKDRVSVFLDV